MHPICQSLGLFPEPYLLPCTKVNSTGWRDIQWSRALTAIAEARPFSGSTITNARVWARVRTCVCARTHTKPKEMTLSLRRKKHEQWLESKIWDAETTTGKWRHSSRHRQELSGKNCKVLFQARQQDLLLREQWTRTQDQALWRRAGLQSVTFKQILILLFTPVSVAMHVWVSVETKGLGPPWSWAGVTDNCDRSDVGVGNWTWVLFHVLGLQMCTTPTSVRGRERIIGSPVAKASFLCWQRSPWAADSSGSVS